MKDSEITFTTGGETYTRKGQVSTSYLIAQATKEFGEINVIKQSEGYGTFSDAQDQTPAHIHILEVALFNLTTAHDQLSSVDQEVHDALIHIVSAMAIIDTKLEELRG